MKLKKRAIITKLKSIFFILRKYRILQIPDH